MRVPRDKVRAYDVYTVVAAILVGLGSVATVLAITFADHGAAYGVAFVPLAFGIGILVRLSRGWRPADRSLDRGVPEEVLETDGGETDQEVESCRR